MSKTCKHFNKTGLSNAVIQVVDRKGSVILTKICIVTTNVNLINFTNKTCVDVNILTMTQQDRNTSEWSTGTIYSQ
jgi:hypothetical protein